MYHFSLRTLYVLDKRPCDAKMLHCTAFFFIQTEFAYYFPSCAMHWCVHSDVPFLQISCHLKRSRGKVFFLYYWLIICNFSRRLINHLKIIIHCNYNNIEINAFNLTVCAAKQSFQRSRWSIFFLVNIFSMLIFSVAG